MHDRPAEMLPHFEAAAKEVYAGMVVGKRDDDAPVPDIQVRLTFLFVHTYRGGSLIRKCHPLGPCSRPIPRALRWSWGKGSFL